MTMARDPKRPVSPVTIGTRRIGPGEPVFIVAEAGVNHNGCVETAISMVDAAAEAGADAVKFQMFRANDLVTATAPTAEYQQRNSEQRSQRAMLERLELSPEKFRTIKQHCDLRSIMFLATPFGEREVGELEELGVSCIKIASTDLTNGRLLESAAATGLPIILSTGATTEEEICRSVGLLRRCGAGERLTLLHCVSCYPTPLEAINLRAILTLEGLFAVPCGLSDHTTSLRTGGWAVAAGACVLEKHFTLDQSSQGPDHAMSLTPTQLREYVVEVRTVERAVGDGVVGMTDREADVRVVACKSVVAAVDIRCGTRLTPEMLTLRRPGTGIPAAEVGHLPGRCATVDIASDTVLSWDMVR